MVWCALLAWLLAAPGIGAAARLAQPSDAEWGLVSDTQPVEVERSCRVDRFVVKSATEAHVRTLGGSPGAAARPDRALLTGGGHSIVSRSTRAMSDGRDTHLRLAVFLI